MRLAPLLALLMVLAPVSPVVLPFTQVYAQETIDIPLPRPRPDRTGTETPPPVSTDPTPATEAIEALADVPQPVSLSARITDGGTPIPDGLVWRIFESTPDANGEMALVAKADAATPRLELRPGSYMVHVAYGQAQTSEPLSVVAGDNQLDIILEAGALRLNSAVTGDIPISPALLNYEIFTAGSETSRALIVESLPPNTVITLNAGTYQIVSHFGTLNAVVRADLRVEPGQLTDATLYHQASQVSFRLVSEAGGEAIADVEWTVKTDDGNTIFSERGAFPSTVLAEGEYLVLAKLGDQVFNREIQIQAGSPREIEVLSTAF